MSVSRRWQPINWARTVSVWSGLLVAWLVLTAAAFQAPKNDFIVYGGDVVTMDEADTMAEAVWVRDGRIEAVGTREEMMRHVTKITELIDLQGGALLPGFIDPHVHLDLQTLMSFYVDLNPCLPDRYETRKHCPMTMFDALNEMKRAAERAKKGEWVIGNGIDPSLMPFNQVKKVNDFRDSPARYIEENISATNPILILDKSGHLAYVNLQAFVAAGICKNVETCGPKTATTQPQPPGEWVPGKDGLFSGLLKEQQAFWPFTPAIPQPGAEEFFKKAEAGARDFARGGVTTIGNGGTMGGPLGYSLLPTLALRSRSHPLLRYRTLLPMAPAGENALIPPQPTPMGEIYDGLFDVTGLKLWADGSTQGCTANLKEDYDGEGLCGEVKGLGLSSDQIQAYLEQFWKAGWPIQIHVNGDQGILNVLNALAALQAETRNDSPITLLHFTVDGNPAKGEDVVQRVADLRAGRFVVDRKTAPPVDVRVSHLIGHVAYWGGALQNILDGVQSPEQRDEKGRAARIDATRRDLDLGVPFSLHSDAPVSPVRPLWYVEQAVTRNTWFYPNLGDDDVHTMPGGQKITIKQALRAVTIEPAKQHGLEGKIGSIEVGKLADLVILDKNPLEQKENEIHRIRVLSTFVSGYRNDWSKE